MKKVNIGGVPEHFNLAWYLTLKNGEYKAEDINLRWHDYHGGTGQMCKGLRNSDIDLAVILTFFKTYLLVFNDFATTFR